MEASALTHASRYRLLARRSPLLRLQGDDRLVALIRAHHDRAFEVLFDRYQPRLLAFCRGMLACAEDAEDVLQDVFVAAHAAMLADSRPINVRPWLYRIARNRSLNHLRRIQAIGVDSMDIHFSEHGASTADKVHDREQFRLLVGDIQGLPETQRTALVLREMDALSYDQIAEAMDTTVPGVKSLLVRARISLAEAAEARQLSCAEVRIELGEVAEGLAKRPTPLVRRHLRSCRRCASFQTELRQTNKALAALLPIGPARAPPRPGRAAPAALPRARAERAWPRARRRPSPERRAGARSARQAGSSRRARARWPARPRRVSRRWPSSPPALSRHRTGPTHTGSAPRQQSSMRSWAHQGRRPSWPTTRISSSMSVLPRPGTRPIRRRRSQPRKPT